MSTLAFKSFAVLGLTLEIGHPTQALLRGGTTTFSCVPLHLNVLPNGSVGGYINSDRVTNRPRFEALAEICRMHARSQTSEKFFMQFVVQPKVTPVAQPDRRPVSASCGAPRRWEKGKDDWGKGKGWKGKDPCAACVRFRVFPCVFAFLILFVRNFFFLFLLVCCFFIFLNLDGF